MSALRVNHVRAQLYQLLNAHPGNESLNEVCNEILKWFTRGAIKLSIAPNGNLTISLTEKGTLEAAEILKELKEKKERD